jgi:polysaccharide biosynthesis transport protein
MDQFALDTSENIFSELAFAWRRKGIVLFVLLAGLGLGYLYFLNAEPIYESKAELLILENKTNIPMEAVEDRATSEDVHIKILRSQRVIRQALEKLNSGPLAKIREEPLTEGYVQKHLLVEGGNKKTSGGKTGSVLELRYESPFREECPLVLDAIIASYRDFLREMFDKSSDETVELITNAKNQLEKQVSDLEAEYRQFRQDSPLFVSSQSAQNIHETRLTQIEEVRAQTLLDNLKLQAQIDSIRLALETGANRDALNTLVGLEKSTLPADLARMSHMQLFPLLVEEQMLVERYGKDHPRVSEIRKRIETTRKYIADMEKDRGPLELAEEQSFDDKYYEVYIDSLKEQIKINDQVIAEMDERFESEKASSKELMDYYIKDETYKAEIDRKARMFEVIFKRLEELNLIKDREGIELQPIHVPDLGRQVKPRLLIVMAISTVLGTFAGLGLGYVVDLADRRFRSPDDIRSYLGVPVVGNIPLLPSVSRRERKKIATASSMVPELRSVFEPQGQLAEAYRAVRTSLYFSSRGGGQRVIQVTSPNPGDGKSTLASNLAVTVANSGKRVLLVDADFRRPRVHKIFGVDNTVGVTGVIDGDFEIADVVQESEVKNLSILPCGRRPHNPSELLTSREFDELLGVLREQYDLIIVDTPPVLAVTDPLNVAPRVDGVLVVLRLTKAARVTSEQTLEALEEVGAKVLGVVVNGVGKGSDYSSYSYGKKYGPRYGSAYKYRDKVAKSYYGDDPEEALEVAVSSNGKH